MTTSFRVDIRFAVWEVWQGTTLVCSKEMRLTAAEARGKVQHEALLGYAMVAKPAPARHEREWRAQTRVNKKRDADSIADLWRMRGFDARVVTEK